MTEVFGPFLIEGADRYADAGRVYRRLWHATGGQLNQLLTEAGARGPAAAEGDDEATRAAKAAQRAQTDARAEAAGEKLRQATLYAFELSGFDPGTGKGMREAPLQQLLVDFLEAHANG